MIVYDVVETIEDGLLPGKWLLNSFDNEYAAKMYATICNNGGKNIQCEVKMHNANSPLRAVRMSDFVKECHKIGINAKDVIGTPRAHQIINQMLTNKCA